MVVEKVRTGVSDKSLRSLKNPLYLNANLVYSEALNLLQSPSWKTKIKTGGTLQKLRKEGFNLVTSIITRMEVMQRLRREKSCTHSQAKKMYFEALNQHEIVEITSVHNSVKLTPDLFDHIGHTKLDFKDALHLQLAKSLDIPLCTHDKKMRGKWSQHPDKGKFYERVYKPEELIGKKITQNLLQ